MDQSHQAESVIPRANPRDEAPEHGDPGLLVVRQAGGEHALPLAAVREVLHPGRVARVPGAPAYVRGLSRVRGEALPVVDLGVLLEGVPVDLSAPRARLVAMGIGPNAEAIALLVQEVVGLTPSAASPSLLVLERLIELHGKPPRAP